MCSIVGSPIFIQRTDSMHQHRLIILLVACCCCFASGSLLHAQQTEDYRLSSDPLEYRLPQDMQIQSAGDVEGKTLVVWGTMVESDDGVIPALVLHINGTQRLLSSESARPYGVVSVVPLADRFLVLWNDRREDSYGIYGAYVRTSGVAGDEFLVSAEGRLKDHPVLVQTGDRYLLTWIDVRDGGKGKTWGVFVGANGTFSGVPSLLSSGQFNVQGSVKLSDGTTLLNMGNAPALVLSSQGTFLPQTVDPRKTNSPHSFRNDGTALVVHDGTFSFYSSVFDSLPAWQTPVPIPDNAYGVLLGKDSAGFYVAWSILFFESAAWSVTVYVARVDSNAVISSGIETYALQILASRGSVQNVKILQDEVQHGCNGTALYTLSFQGEYREAYSGQDFRPFTGGFSYAIDTNGVLRYWKKDGGDFDKGLELTECRINVGLAPPLVERVRSDTISSVQHASVIYAAPSAIQEFHAEARWPWINARDGKMEVAYHSVGIQSFIHATYSSFPSNKIQTKSLIANPKDRAPSHQFWGGSMYGMAGGTEKLTLYQQPGYEYDFFYELIVPTSEGWVLKTLQEEKGRTYGTISNTSYIKYVDEGFDPNANTVAIATYFQATKYLTLSLWDKEWQKTSEYRLYQKQPWSGQVLPANANVVLFVGTDDTVRRVELGQGLVGQFPLQPSEGQAMCCYRLLGDTFIRLIALEEKQFRLELYSLSGSLLAHRTIESAVPEFPFLVQNPKDSSIAFLWGGSSGVRCTVLDNLLKDVINSTTRLPTANVQISATQDVVAHPAAIFVNDMLYVVWEDFRNGPTPEIYSTLWKFEKSGNPIINDEEPDNSSNSNQLTLNVAIRALHPNPARGVATIVAVSAHRFAGTLSLYDVIGRRVFWQEIILNEGEHEYPLDISNLRSGRYQVVLESSQSKESREIIVYGE